MADRAWEKHQRAVQRLADSYAAIPVGQPVRLAKRTTNLFRPRAASSAPGLDVSGLDGVLEVLPDTPDGPVAEVQGMCTYETLVDATLPHGLVPHVVPQLRTITLGGAVSGLGIESTSFRLGLPHESVLDMDVFTGAGAVVPTKPGEPLFDAFPNSYGSLGYATRLRIKLARVAPYVALRHLRFDDAEHLAKTVQEIAALEEYDGRPVHALDGVSFGRGEHVLTLATWTEEGGATSDYTGQRIYYRSLQTCDRDRLTTYDYLWRWDTDWFWCSRAFGVQKPAVRRWVPRRLMRSDTWWRLVAFERRHRWKERWDVRRGGPPREYVIQDVEIPVDRLAEFMAVFAREMPIEPVWFCPLRQRDRDVVWELYELDPDVLYVNVGFWSTVALEPGEPDGTHNRLVERLVADLDGRKSLYSTSFYDEDEFWRLYGGEVYERLKKSYDPDGRLLHLYAKCVQGR